MNIELFQEKLKLHKLLIANLAKEKNRKFLVSIIRSGKLLALAYSKCKCEKEKCNKKKDLQYHHLINRDIKQYTDFYRYLSQRHYWGNMLILCEKHHCEIHNRPNKVDGKKYCITEEKIKQVKEMFKIK